MALVNTEVNKAINKIVTFVNEKVSIPFTESIAQLTQKINLLENSREGGYFGGLRVSAVRSDRKASKAEYREILTGSRQ